MPDVDRLSRKLSWDDITDLVIFMIPIGIIFARLYYCIFNWDYYSEHISEIIKIWHGGLAIYGGIIGGLLTAIVFCKIRKIQFLDLADFCIPFVALSQSIGRWGNFVNREAYGERTNSFLKMGLFSKQTNQIEYYHPTFLYESICTLLIFIILSRVDKKKKFAGQAFYLYFILYGIARFFIEGLRMDSLYFANTNIRVSQVLSLVLAIVFSIIYIWKRFNIGTRLKGISRKNGNGV